MRIPADEIREDVRSAGIGTGRYGFRINSLLGFLIGSKAPPEVVSLNSKYLKVIGFVPDLTEFMHQLRCTVAPLRYGAGLKAKILDSFSRGLPCVMSAVAVEGFNWPPELEWLIARTPREIAEKLVAVHEDEALN